MFVFRVSLNENSGLGHLTRCLLLIEALQKHDQTCLFIVDKLLAQVQQFLADKKVYCLSCQPGSPDDAEQTLAIINQFAVQTVQWLVVDHYGIDASWEAQMIAAGLKVLALDDVCREHAAQAVLDYKWRGESSVNCYTRPGESKDLLLGPHYVLLPAHKPSKAHTDDTFRMLIGLGGGGSAALLNDLVLKVVQSFNEMNKKLHLKVIVGPLLDKPAALWRDRAEFSGVNIDWLQGKTDLTDEMDWCDFYLGAAGSSLYQLRALQKPALLFSLNASQQTDQSLLDDIGQYFYLEGTELVEGDAFTAFLKTLVCNFERIQRLFKQAKITIDDQGVERVVNFLLHSKRAVLNPAQDANQAWQSLTNHYQIRPVKDGDINHYLRSRNHPANRQNMLNHETIERLSHYAWWFNNSRRSFLLAKSGVPKLYIWEQVQTYQDERFLIGGWFVCDEHASFQDAMLALDWQIKQCDQDYPGVKWIAVISQQNRYVKLLNEYFGFQEIPPSSRYMDIANAFFPNANSDEFVAVYR